MEVPMGGRLFMVCAAGLLVTGCFKQKPVDQNAESAKQIHQLLANWSKAFAAKDANAVMAMYAPGFAFTAYDIVPPLQFKGFDAYKKDYADFFAQFDGPIRVEIADEHLEVSGDLATDYALEHITGKLKDGKPADVWLRATSVFKRIGGKWLDIHDHVSVPADMATGKAALDLKP